MIPRIAALIAALFSTGALAQAIERVQGTDPALDCPAIARESAAMDEHVKAGTSENSAGKTAAGTAANVGGQVAGGAIAQSVGGLFGALGSVVGQVTGAVAQQTAEKKMEPDAAAKDKAVQAQARKDFLARLAAAKDCAAGGEGKALSEEEFKTVAAVPVEKPFAPLTADTVKVAIAEPVTPIPAALEWSGGNVDLKGKRFYVSEFRVLFEVAGTVSASTRGGYLPGRDYGSTRARVNYVVPKYDIAAFQAITDKAFEDFKARLRAAGLQVEEAEPFVKEHGAIYEATEAASTPEKPVFYEKNLGHTERKYLVVAPTGMKMHARGFGGIGGGDHGKRREYRDKNLDAIAVSMAVNIAALESSGSGSSITRRGSSASASEGMAISGAPDVQAVMNHTMVGGYYTSQAIPVPGTFARWSLAGGYDTDKDATGRAVGILTNLAGMGANKTRREDYELQLDGTQTARLALQGLASMNEALVKRIVSN
ncbi:MAG TPA: hypothetical protein VEB41_01560 [Burkholderiales bacterium]|nr:hypothetical protein [Burkholderiales bacterium]